MWVKQIKKFFVGAKKEGYWVQFGKNTGSASIIYLFLTHITKGPRLLINAPYIFIFTPPSTFFKTYDRMVGRI